MSNAPRDATGAGSGAEAYAAITGKIGQVLRLPASGAWPEVPHKLDADSAHAIIAAAAAGRPLLVRGEPGVGKSQLARAAAHLLGRPFLAFVVQPDSEYQELLWAMDHTARLADAQLGERANVRVVKNYVGPGALWWALNWPSAQAQATHCRHTFNPPEDLDPAWPAKHGSVLLIDEIDKADIALANGLLEVLGNGQFAVPPLGLTVRADAHPPPLVVLTSNDTRQLPAALLRRCVVLRMPLPDDLQSHFVDRGETHFPDLDPRVLGAAAEQILADRAACAPTARTGLAEYLDLLRALRGVATDAEGQIAWLDRLGLYFKKSHAG
jgi:MoxR-like ATPase